MRTTARIAGLVTTLTLSAGAMAQPAPSSPPSQSFEPPAAAPSEPRAPATPPATVPAGGAPTASPGGAPIAPAAGAPAASPAAPTTPCAPRFEAVDATHRYVVCDASTVLVLDGASGTTVRVIRVDGVIADLYVRGNRVWVERVRNDAVPITGTATQPNLQPWPHTGVPFGPAAARPKETKGRYRRRVAPPRATGVELGVVPRFFLGTGSSGTLSEAWFAYRAEAPLSLGVRLSPIGFGIGDENDFGVYHVFGHVAYDHDWFEVGIGFGATRVRVDDFTRIANGNAPTFSLPVRFGARDGFHIEATSTVAFIDSDTVYAGTIGSIQIPMLDTSWLVLRGGGSGVMGYGFGELGLRILVRGDRGPGSIFVTPNVGGLGLFDTVNDADHGGFSAGLGVEFRP